MNHLKSKTMGSKGFTLVEIIVTIVAAGILGAIFVQLMGTALSSSWNSVEIVRDEANAERLMERIIGEYVALINNDPDTALDIIDDGVIDCTIHMLQIIHSFLINRNAKWMYA